MFGLFKKQSAIDEDFYEWSVDFTDWVIENFDGIEQLKKTPLVTPTGEFFPPGPKESHAFAEHLAAYIKKHADMEEWNCMLTAQSERAPGFMGDTIQRFSESLPLGTFKPSSERNPKHVEITYDPALLETPHSLIATLSHEFAHYLMTTAKTPPPGGWDLEEPATDALAIFMGFGIFITNDTFEFSNNTQGWEWQRRVYLCDGENLHALSAFILASRTDIKDALKYLKPHLAKRLGRIHQEMSMRPEFQKFAP